MHLKTQSHTEKALNAAFLIQILFVQALKFAKRNVLRSAGQDANASR